MVRSLSITFLTLLGILSPIPAAHVSAQEASAKPMQEPVAAAEPAAKPSAEQLEAARQALEAADGAYHQAAHHRNRAEFSTLLDPDASFLAGELHRGRIAYLGVWGPLWEGKYGFRYEGEVLAATVAESGEIGWTVGDVTTSFTRPGLTESQETKGQYLTVWQRDEAGSWKVRLSASLVVHPELGAARDPRSGLMTAWPELADRVGAAFDIRWQPEATVRASSGELAYTFGAYRAEIREGEETLAGGGHFLAVWQKDEQGRWQLAAEGLTPPDIHGSPEG